MLFKILENPFITINKYSTIYTLSKDYCAALVRLYDINIYLMF